jgi:hypothetical protein
MKNLSTGTGLALLATAIVAYPFVNRISSVDQPAHASVPVAAIAAAATAQAQPEPTVVWYGTCGGYCTGFTGGAVLRAWSDGTLEIKKLGVFAAAEACSPTGPCSSPWFVISSPTSGFSAASDINFDERVDGADLAQLLADFGDAPRQDIPQSNCPLNLINP